MNIQELKEKSSEKLITEAEKLGIENASTLRRQEIYFAILKKLAEKGEEIISNKKVDNIKETKITSQKKESATDFTEVNFDELGKD